MREALSGVPNVFSPDQVAQMQQIFDEICAEFGFEPTERETRLRLAEGLIAIAQSQPNADEQRVLIRAVACRLRGERANGPD